MLLDILILAIGLATLILGGDVLVKGASRVALRFNVSPMIVGLTIVAFSTSAPELLVSLNAALKEAPDFAMGNVVFKYFQLVTCTRGSLSVWLYPNPQRNGYKRLARYHAGFVLIAILHMGWRLSLLGRSRTLLRIDYLSFIPSSQNEKGPSKIRYYLRQKAGY